MGGGISRLTYQLGSNFAALGGIGEATVLSLNAGYAVIRSFKRNLSLQANLERKKLRDEIQLTGSINPKDSNSAGINVNYDQKDQFLGGGSLNGALNLNLGSLTLNDAAQQASDRAGLKTAGSYTKLGYDLSRQQALTGTWSLFGRLAGQAASKNLDSSEKLGLTGPSGVRAYSVGEASVDRGNYANLEVRYSHAYLGGMLVFSAFHDQGWGSYNAQPLVAANTVHLYGSGIGLQWMAGDGYGLNATLASRGKRPPTAGSDVNPRLYIQLFNNL